MTTESSRGQDRPADRRDADARAGPPDQEPRQPADNGALEARLEALTALVTQLTLLHTSSMAPRAGDPSAARTAVVPLAPPGAAKTPSAPSHGSAPTSASGSQPSRRPGAGEEEERPSPLASRAFLSIGDEEDPERERIDRADPAKAASNPRPAGAGEPDSSDDESDDGDGGNDDDDEPRGGADRGGGGAGQRVGGVSRDKKFQQLLFRELPITWKYPERLGAGTDADRLFDHSHRLKCDKANVKIANRALTSTFSAEGCSPNRLFPAAAKPVVSRATATGGRLYLVGKERVEEVKQVLAPTWKLLEQLEILLANLARLACHGVLIDPLTLAEVLEAGRTLAERCLLNVDSRMQLLRAEHKAGANTEYKEAAAEVLQEMLAGARDPAADALQKRMDAHAVDRFERKKLLKSDAQSETFVKHKLRTSSAQAAESQKASGAARTRSNTAAKPSSTNGNFKAVKNTNNNKFNKPSAEKGAAASYNTNDANTKMTKEPRKEAGNGKFKVDA